MVDFILERVGNIYTYCNTKDKSVIQKYLNTRILPKEYEKIKQLLDYHKNKDSKVLIIDDKDFDGTSCLVCCYNKLLTVWNTKTNLKIYNNHRHGVNETVLASCSADSYDLVIILDSSTNLVELYKSNVTDYLVIDHHEPDMDIQNCTPDNVISCNSKLTKGLESISAGMLTWLIFSEYTQDFGDYEWAATSLYSDIVPVDEVVADHIIQYFYGDLTKKQNFIGTQLEDTSKTKLQWGAIPLINYSRRLEDDHTINLLVKGYDDYVLEYMEKNRQVGKDIMKAMTYYRKIDQSFNNFVCCDVSEINDFITEPVENFIGLFCNRLVSQYKKPAITFLKESEDTIRFSVRSNHINSLDFFSKDNRVDGGGHQNACGFTVNIEDFKNVMQGYEEYLNPVNGQVQYVLLEDILPVDDVSYLTEELMKDIALYNEFAYSSTIPKIIVQVSNVLPSTVSQPTYNQIQIKGCPWVIKGDKSKIDYDEFRLYLKLEDRNSLEFSIELC